MYAEAVEVLPAAFYSRQLHGAEQRYSATELEALVVVESIKHFLHFVWPEVRSYHGP